MYNTSIMFGYQKDLQERLWKILLDRKAFKRGAVLGSTPGSGKTNMSIRLVERWLKKHPNDKVLVLTHGQTNLRTQYMGRIDRVRREQGLGKHFHEVELEEGIEPVKHRANVHVGIPQFFGKKFKKLPYALVVIDEVHHYYGPKGAGADAGMVQDILRRCPPSKRILGLSGTPFDFRYPESEIFEGFGQVTKAAEELMEAGVLTDPRVELSTTSLPILEKDFRGAELNEAFIFKQKDIDTALGQAVKNLLQPLSKRLKGIRTGYPKTLIRCHSIAQASLVHDFFRRQGLLSFTSDTKSDPDSTHLALFKDKKSWEKWGRPFLIVVDRGVLGFDDPELETVIDLSCSKDVAGLFQLYCRVVRKSEENPKKAKQFIKVCPKGMVPQFAHYMSAVVHLCLTWFYDEYPGPKALRPPRFENLMMDRGPKGIGYGGGNEPARFILPTVLEVKDIFRRVEQGDENYSTWGLTSLNDCRRIAGEEFRDGDASLEEAKALTLKLGKLPSFEQFPTESGCMKYWARTAPDEYREWLSNNGIDYQAKTRWTKESLLEDARKYKTPAEWRRASKSAAQIAKSVGPGFLAKCIEHMNSPFDGRMEELRSWVSINKRRPRRVKYPGVDESKTERLLADFINNLTNRSISSSVSLSRLTQIEALFKKYNLK